MDQRRFPLPLMRWRLKEKEVNAGACGNAGVRQQKEKTVHSAWDKTPVPANCAREVIPAPPVIQPRPRIVPHSFFFSFGPCTARFLFFFWKKKRKWGVQCTSHRWYPVRPARKGEYQPGLTARYAP